jgi:hypothetical protein
LEISLLLTLSGAAVALFTAGCSTPSDGVPCPRREAAFRLELTAPGAAMPADTAIEVAYQGSGTETFSLMATRQNEDVCCRLGVPTDGPLPHVSCVKNPPSFVPTDASRPNDGGDALSSGDVPDAMTTTSGAGGAGDGATQASASGARKTTALFCELFTNGPATIHVTASGYPVLDQELKSKLREDNCGVRTVDVRVVLPGPDGGSP